MKRYVISTYDEVTQFEESVCATCGYQPVCMITTEASVQDSNDADYPKELVLADNGTPTCLSYIRRSN
jgi:hypothetical protein